MSESCLSVVILGASGDLARKKTFPALYSLYLYNQLPLSTYIYAYSRSFMDREKLLSMIEKKLTTLTKQILPEDDFVEAGTPLLAAGATPAVDAAPSSPLHPRLAAFLDMVSFVQCRSYDDEESAQRLNKAIAENEARAASDNSRRRSQKLIIYLALPPDQFIPAVHAFRQNCWRERSVEMDCWTHIVVEKPFGRDHPSALKMSQQLASHAAEEEIFRIDHYLGKEMVLNLFILRFANSFISPIWDRHHIKSVRITFKESIGTFGRGGYFDKFGVIRDVVQNHLLQILSLVAMEPPVTLNDEHIRDEKVKLLRAVACPTLEHTVIGQYCRSKRPVSRPSSQTRKAEAVRTGLVASAPGDEVEAISSAGLSRESVEEPLSVLSSVANSTGVERAESGRDAQSGDEEYEIIPGYLDDPTVPKGSLCPTFVTTVLWINNERWSGVPFILKAGKALETQSAEIRIQLHGPKNHLYDITLPQNELVMRIQPDDAIYMKCLSKKPGLSGADADIVETELDLSVLDRHGVTRVHDAYERLLLDVINGDKKNFVRTDELLEAWRIFDPLLHAIESKPVKPSPYPAGSHGPVEHYDLINSVGYSRYDGYVWHRSVSK